MKDEIKENVEPTLEYLKMCVEDDTLFETSNCKALLDYITNLQVENKRLKENNQEMQKEMCKCWERMDKMFEYYFLGNLKYDQDTVNTIYIKYVQLKELKDTEN